MEVKHLGKKYWWLEYYSDQKSFVLEWIPAHKEASERQTTVVGGNLTRNAGIAAVEGL